MVTDNTSKCDALSRRETFNKQWMLIFSSWDKYAEHSDLTPVRGTDNKMRSSSSYAAAASEHHLLEPLSALDDHMIAEGCPQSVTGPPTYCIRAAGVLRYNRESDNHRINLTTTLQELVTESEVKCEYCGEKARPSLNLTWPRGPESGPHVCCAQRQWLYEMLVKERCLAEGRADPRTTTSPGDKPEAEELVLQGKEMEDHNKFIMDLSHGLGEQPDLRVYEDYSLQLPVAETSSKVLSFRLSLALGEGCWSVNPCGATETHLKIKEEEEQPLVPFCDHKSLKFGLCHHQAGAEFLQKYYPSGTKFLTVFPDGSAQVFYPSGLLALIVVVTEENRRVCIVYDDGNASCQPIRALFQSDSRATCYHINGNIWMTLNNSGGQCLDEMGARVRRWSWGSPSLTPTPLQPVFLSLNKSVGVRVLGKEQVFVSFLAKGQQVKFSVGTCCAQAECKTNTAASGPPPVLKEELFVLAARIRINLAIKHLRQCLITPSHPRLLKTTQAPQLHYVAQRLLEVSANVMMSESERAFIYRCLQDCLKCTSNNYTDTLTAVANKC